MNIETVVKLIQGVCILILERPNTTRMEKLIANKVLVEVVGDSGAALPRSQREAALSFTDIPLLERGEE